MVKVSTRAEDPTSVFTTGVQLKRQEAENDGGKRGKRLTEREDGREEIIKKRQKD